ncbi:hypothetical protein FRC14_006264 [Serendipita sp. 396]|nr:hypothetical protein FRC14_006264 [Serendipita sp. 396]KAG8878103.1 hypothetical protein FRC20_009388 [Serendipita sp. 405]
MFFNLPMPMTTTTSSSDDDSSVSSQSDVFETAVAGPTEAAAGTTRTALQLQKPRTLYLTVARVDQSPLTCDDADYAELQSIACSSESDLSEYFSDYLSDGRAIQGSQPTFSTTTSTYMLPIDPEEFKRLDKQHTVLKLGIWDLEPLRNLLADALGTEGPDQKAALDVGCGSGQWALEFAVECSKVKVMAIDETPQMREDLPSNVEFQQHDVNDGLELYYNSYDVVHVRCIGAGITSYRQLLTEVFKCLRPGGVAIFIEGDFDLLEEKQMYILEPASDSNPNGSWLQRWVQAVRKAQVHRCKLKDPDDSPETLDKGLWQFDLYESSTCGTGSIFTPVSPWPESDLPEESLHYKVVGVLMRQNLKIFLHSTQSMLIEDGVSREDTETWMAHALSELEGPLKAWFRWRVAWGRRTPDSTVPIVKATPVATAKNFKAHMFPSPQNIEARKNLMSKVKHFARPQTHIRNEQQSLEYIKQRESLSFSTRGKFFDD